jgi:hypothetical protein
LDILIGELVTGERVLSFDAQQLYGAEKIGRGRLLPWVVMVSLVVTMCFCLP